MIHLERSQAEFHQAAGQLDSEHRFTLIFWSSLQDISDIYSQLPENTITQLEFKNMIGGLLGRSRIEQLRPLSAEAIKVSKSNTQKKDSSCKTKKSVSTSSFRDIKITGG